MQGEVRDSPWSYDQNVRFQADALDQTSIPGGISDLKPAKEARGGPQRRTLIGCEGDSRWPTAHKQAEAAPTPAQTWLSWFRRAIVMWVIVHRGRRHRTVVLVGCWVMTSRCP
jgi:hypothetical protein